MVKVGEPAGAREWWVPQEIAAQSWAIAEVPDKAYWDETNSSRCLLLGQPQVGSLPRSPAATPLPIPLPHPSPQVGLPYGCHRAQLHHCQQVFSKLCTKDSRRFLLPEPSQALSAAQLVESQCYERLSSLHSGPTGLRSLDEESTTTGMACPFR